MPKMNVINVKGEKVKDIKLDDKVWSIEPNDAVIYDAIVLQMASLRQGTHKVKTRAEVSGGGRKPWKQKGTGRARQGSIRATQWRGGGIAMGVNPRDYSFKINKKERVLALRSALADKVNEKKFIVVDSLAIASNKTKDIKTLYNDLKLSGKVLFVADEDADKLYLATRNLPTALVLFADELNVYDVVDADYVVIDEKSLAQVEEVLK